MTGKSKAQSRLLRYQEAVKDLERPRACLRFNISMGGRPETVEHYREDVKRLEDQAERIRAGILQELARLPDLQREVMRARYLELDPGGRLRKWSIIADQIGRTEKHTIHLHRLALESLAER